MTKKPENPQAFPTSVSVSPAGDVYQGQHDGMSLRDWFAGKFLSSEATLNMLSGAKSMGDTPYDAAKSIAEFSYLVADAMLAEREK